MTSSTTFTHLVAGAASHQSPATSQTHFLLEAGSWKLEAQPEAS